MNNIPMHLKDTIVKGLLLCHIGFWIYAHVWQAYNICEWMVIMQHNKIDRSPPAMTAKWDAEMWPNGFAYIEIAEILL